jgi:hypothetical protein
MIVTDCVRYAANTLLPSCLMHAGDANVYVHGVHKSKQFIF